MIFVGFIETMAIATQPTHKKNHRISGGESEKNIQTVLKYLSQFFVSLSSEWMNDKYTYICIKKKKYCVAVLAYVCWYCMSIGSLNWKYQLVEFYVSNWCDVVLRIHLFWMFLTKQTSLTITIKPNISSNRAKLYQPKSKQSPKISINIYKKENRFSYSPKCTLNIYFLSDLDNCLRGDNTYIFSHIPYTKGSANMRTIVCLYTRTHRYTAKWSTNFHLQKKQVANTRGCKNAPQFHPETIELKMCYLWSTAEKTMWIEYTYAPFIHTFILLLRFALIQNQVSMCVHTQKRK